MTSPSTQFASANRMSIYNPLHQISIWEETLGPDICPKPDLYAIPQVDSSKLDYTSQGSDQPSGSNQPTKNTSDNKTQRRLAQNREAARKCRLRKKAYVQQLETSRLKLAQLEQELVRARQQGWVSLGAGSSGFPGTKNSGISAFEMEYGHWVAEQQKKNSELRNALQSHISDTQLLALVESGLKHYYELCRMKENAAKTDVFYLMFGVWQTSVERFFLWIGGFRPSEILNILVPQIEPLTDQQIVAVWNLQHSCQQAEDALSQGMDKLQQTLTHSITTDTTTGVGSYFSSQATSTIEKLEALEHFVNQADNLRQQTLQQMSRILTARQAARGLLALGDYFERLRTLSSLWAARHREEPI